MCIDVRASQIELMKRRYVEAAGIADKGKELRRVV